MSHFNLSTSARFQRVENAVAAGTGDTITGDTVDMSGFNQVAFVFEFGTITATAVTTCKLQTSSDDAAWNDLEGTALSVADSDDNQIAIIEVNRPRERYIRSAIVRATANAVIDGVVAIQTDAASVPTTHDSSTVVGFEFHAGPAEGTA